MGKNTATKAKVVATTAKPISSAASFAACRGVLPILKCRTIFSTSTIASSTKMPITRDNASRVMTFNENPKYSMPIKAGITESGKAIAETKVARQSRKNNQTTKIASKAPSYSMVIEP